MTVTVRRWFRTGAAAAVCAVAAFSGASWWVDAQQQGESAVLLDRQPVSMSVEEMTTAATVAALLEQVGDRVVVELPDVGGYDRECGPGEGCVFGPAWTDDYVGAGGRDGCDTRSQALGAQLDDVAFKPGTRDCKVVAGVLVDPYSGQPVLLDEIDIDHVYPLSRSWAAGASAWSLDARVAFANDLEVNLVATSSALNRAKGDSGLDEWVPPAAELRCTYAGQYLTVADRYGLLVTSSDVDVARSVCGLPASSGDIR